MAAAALAVIFAMRLPQQHQKGAFDSYKDVTGERLAWFPDLGAFVCLNSTTGAFGYVVPEQGAFGVAAAARLRLV
nr:hypothetical protein [Tanacetum cinerariifolium]